MAEPVAGAVVSATVVLPPCLVAGRLPLQVLLLTVQEMSVVSATQGASQESVGSTAPGAVATGVGRSTRGGAGGVGNGRATAVSSSGSFGGAGVGADRPRGVGGVGTARWLSDTHAAGADAVCRAGEGLGGNDLAVVAAVFHSVVAAARVVGVPSAGDALIGAGVAHLIGAGAVDVLGALHASADGGVAALGRR